MYVNIMSQFLYRKLPENPGVYLMKDKAGKILYIGKAANLRRRVSSYFTRGHDYRIEKLVNTMRNIDYKRTDTALEALILEAELIKKYQPPFNVREKDDKSFLYVEITDDNFPRVLLVRGKNKFQGRRFGPFTSAASIRVALKILRRIFPFSIHEPQKLGKFIKPCFDYEIGLCPGTCIGVIGRGDYSENIKNIKLIFQGKKKRIINGLNREMETASQKLEFEKAAKIKKQIFALGHIQDVSLINDAEIEIVKKNIRNYRIEGYDVSNISGTLAVGAMVVFNDGQSSGNDYRKFKIRTIKKSDDVGMLKEILRRRFKNSWLLPNLILIDGGKGQINAAKSILGEFGLKIPIVGIAKGPKRKNNKFIGSLPSNVEQTLLIKVRNEAHRFAISYHKKLRQAEFL